MNKPITYAVGIMTITNWPGEDEENCKYFMKDGVEWVNFYGQEMLSKEFHEKILDGSIVCGISPMNLLY